MRTRRVGSITCGILMIFFGILFMVHMFYPPLSLEVIMRLWPLILIALGGELIASNIRKADDSEEILKYDKGAIFYPGRFCSADGDDRIFYELCKRVYDVGF